MNAREIAIKIINTVHSKEAYANVALAKELIKRDVSEQDRRFITELVYGTVKTAQTLDWILLKYINRSLDKITPIILDILRMGVYQIFFMSKVPNSAACNQAVELAKKYGHAGTVKFVNAVLRSAVRAPEKAKYPTLESDPLERISLEFYHPEWLVKKWINQFGIDETIKLCQFDNVSAPLSIRTNTLKTTRSKLMQILADEKIECHISPFAPEGIICTEHPTLGSLKSLKDGLFQVQDESSMVVAHVLDPKPGEIILDTCSAPGGKTTHIAALMKNYGKIIAMDIYEHKLEKIEQNANRLGISIIETKLCDATQIDQVYEKKIDKVLVDAPCSGLGVLRRKADARWKKTAELLNELPILQKRILHSAAKTVKVGGILVYSTCTIVEEENQEVVKAFLEENQEFILENTSDFLPQKDRKDRMIQYLPHVEQVDGFFIARMKRIR